jgi:hypothetical protein
MFDIHFYIARIGMVEGAACLFSQWVAQELKKVQHKGESQDKWAGIEVGEDKERRTSCHRALYIFEAGSLVPDCRFCAVGITTAWILFILASYRRHCYFIQYLTLSSTLTG